MKYVKVAQQGKCVMFRQCLVIVLMSLFISACSDSSSRSTIPDRPPEQLYERAQTSMNAGHFNKAANILEALDTRYPFGPYAVQVQLDLIYVYYKNNEAAKCLANIDRFLRLNPNHREIDYVLYMRGLTNELNSHNFFQSLFNIDRADRDSTGVRAAFRDYQQLIKRFPNSDYAPDARARALKLKHQLARHELAIARYYIKREAYIAAVNRGKYIIETFPDTPASREALEVMVQAYQLLDMPEQAEKVKTISQLNPVSS